MYHFLQIDSDFHRNYSNDMLDDRPITNFKFTQEEYDTYQSGVEVWRDVELWGDKYRISTKGSVFSIGRYVIHDDIRKYFMKGRIMKWCILTTGYPYVTFIRDRKKINKVIHRLVANTFMINFHNKETVNHIDGKKMNPNLENLEFATTRENCQHACDTGLKKPSHLGKFAKDHHRSKLVYQYDLKGNYINEFYGCREAERRTGVSNYCISMCALGKTSHAGFFKWSYIKF